jgi:preprotein translocase subunit SecG
MRIAQSDIQKFKIAAHIFQAILIFIALCLTISVMVKDGETGGATKFFFAMVRRRTCETSGASHPQRQTTPRPC